MYRYGITISTVYAVDGSNGSSRWHIRTWQCKRRGRRASFLPTMGNGKAPLWSERAEAAAAGGGRGGVDEETQFGQAPLSSECADAATAAAAAEDEEMRLAFDAAFGELDFQYLPTGQHAAAWIDGVEAGDSFAVKLATVLDGEVRQRRQQRQAHIEKLLAPPTMPVPARSACATAPVTLAATPPRATATA